MVKTSNPLYEKGKRTGVFSLNNPFILSTHTVLRFNTCLQKMDRRQYPTNQFIGSDRYHYRYHSTSLIAFSTNLKVAKLHYISKYIPPSTFVIWLRGLMNNEIFILQPLIDH